jgi:hypothetical protein
MRPRINKTTLALTRSYLLHPEQHWGSESVRHVQKMRIFMRRALRPGERMADLVDEILAIARLRVNHAPAPIYLPNVGSSGSHWLEAMLAIATGTHACGEVYLPKPMLPALKELPAADAAYFLNAAYMAHQADVGPKLATGHLINSAHLGSISGLASLTPGARTVLLLRHPVDVALSRTLRKPLHRAEVAPEADDRDFLAHSCDVVERFHKAAARERFDCQVRYEDLVAQPAETLATLTAALGLAATPESIRNAVEATSRDAIQSARERGDKAATNLYVGEAKHDEALADWARRRLADCCARLGYAS